MIKKYKHIIDNQHSRLVDHLKGALTYAEAFRIVSAYFTIYGYELLQDELHRLHEVRFLFGDPNSVDDLDPSDKDSKFFTLTEDGLQANRILIQKDLAKQCLKWVESPAVQIRSMAQSNFLHGKMYLADPPMSGAAFVGSSNFTRKGLGGSARPNLEINIKVDDIEAQYELRAWFDDLWSNTDLTEDVKQKVIDALNRIGKDYSPELIYYKTLYELFREEIEARTSGDQQLADAHLYDTEIWKSLFEFQKDGVKSVIARLMRHNGCILADSVGLGKTYTALAVIKFFELRNERVLVLCPKKLRGNWSLYPAHFNNINNPFMNDRFGYSLQSHTDLSRDLKEFNWGNFDLVVIDESHNFRNNDGKRYARLLDEVISKGVNTKVLMLSATPVNTSLTDLRNQIYLMTEKRDDAFKENLGISNIQTMLGAAQRQFHEWEAQAPSNGRRDKSYLMEKLSADFFRLLGTVSISRSRRHIENFYSKEIEKIGKFPTRERPTNHFPPTDSTGEFSYEELADKIEKFKLSIYRPSKYVISEAAKRRMADEKSRYRFDQSDREYYLVGMIRTNFLKRLESSARSLTLTLKRTIDKIDDLLKKIERYQTRRDDADPQLQDDALPYADDDDEDFLINSRVQQPFSLADLDLDKWKEDLEKDHTTLHEAYQNVGQIKPERDGKLHQIKAFIRDRATNPTTDIDGKPNRKVLIFTTFKDTAIYLYDNLTPLAKELGLNISMVSGDKTDTFDGSNDFNHILDNFAPIARRRGSNGAEIDVLIATDCISEGQNLQDCDTVLNYDIHWNPVRIIQRFGRIDRIGSRSKSVHMINYWPTAEMEKYLRLKTRVEARMALADAVATGQDNPFDHTEENLQTELTFRDEQLKRLQNEIIDLDDLVDSVVMSDFTLDQFFDQLLRYLEQNKDQLESIPRGAYALTYGNLKENHHGVIWVLRQRNVSDDKGFKAASPVHPFYLVHIRENGDIRHGCASVRQTLELFDELSAGQDTPITELCDEFDRVTDAGHKMKAYDDLLAAAVKSIASAHQTTQTQNLGRQGNRDFKLPRAPQTPRGINDFELMTWLLIKPKQP